MCASIIVIIKGEGLKFCYKRIILLILLDNTAANDDYTISSIIVVLGITI